jgi:hypothetical protein
MQNKIPGITAFIALALIIAGFIASGFNHQEWEVITQSGLNLFMLSGVYLLVINGDFVKTREFRLCRLGVSFILLAVMVKIMHWSYYEYLLTAGFLSIVLFYLIYLVKHKKKSFISLLKLLFVITILAGRYLKMIHFPFSDELILVSVVLLSIVLTDFLMHRKIFN